MYDALIARRAAREPLQHLTGTAAFRYRELAVGPGVFVPRPETEVMVGWILDRIADVKAPLVVDLCTGSGAIAGAIATERPDSVVHAVELSPEACVWARRNLAGTGAVLHEGDIDGCLPEFDGQVDAVISNPPYIPLTAWESVTAEVRDHDPALALWSGDDGLDEIKVVAATAARLLKPGGWFACEHADVQGESAPAVFTATGRSPRSATNWTWPAATASPPAAESNLGSLVDHEFRAGFQGQDLGGCHQWAVAGVFGRRRV